MAIPERCQQIKTELDGLKQQRDYWRDELKGATAEEKKEIRKRIGALSDRIAPLEVRLANCISPPPAPIDGIFTGAATVTTTYDRAPGPFVSPVRFGVRINGQRTLIALTSFPAIKTAPFDTPLGRNVTTVSRTGGGNGSYAAGVINLPITLRFDQSIDVPLYEEDSTLSVVLSTNPPGSRLSPEPFGAVTLAGSGTFTGGVLGGSTGKLSVRGNISVPVPTTVPDVRELRKNGADAAVVAAGLSSHFTGSTQARNAWVASQSPDPGQKASRGDRVGMFLRDGPIP